MGGGGEEGGGEEEGKGVKREGFGRGRGRKGVGGEGSAMPTQGRVENFEGFTESTRTSSPTMINSDHMRVL